jgi:serine/threonine protein kinase
MKGWYILFPWAAGGNLQDYWEVSEQELSRELVLWSLKQMLGLTQALHKLHEQFQCRHGDLKPGNILCVQEKEETVLKIADFGISKIHHAQTTYRTTATATVFLTPSYQGPEVEFEKIDKTDQRPRSRKYDIWSMGCVFLEFAIWLLHGPEAIKGFANAKGTGKSSTNPSTPLYEVTDKAAKTARVHQLVSWTIEGLQTNPQCKEGTALAALVDLVKNQMLQPEVEKRPTAGIVCSELEIIIQEAQKDPSYLLPSCDAKGIPSLDFDSFQSGTYQDNRTSKLPSTSVTVRQQQ